MKTINYFIIIIQLILLAGCQNWDANPELSTEGFLNKIENGSHEVIGEYTYINGILTESWYHNDLFMNDKNEEYTYTYNSDNQLTEKEGFLPGNLLMSSITGAMDKNISVLYEYDAENRISKIVTSFEYDKESTDLNYKTTLNFEYQEVGEVITFEAFSSALYNPALANSVISKTKYKINKNDDIETVEQYNETNTGNIVTSLEEYTYDSNLSPVIPEPGVHSAHNVLMKKITVYNYDNQGNQSIGYVLEYSYNYEYNSKGYPSKVTETWPNQVQHIKYYYYN